MAIDNWYAVHNPNELISPSLLVYPDRIEENLRRMIVIAGDPGRLRPHIKTHKIAEIIALQIKYGIHKFKCATIPEAHLLADCGAQDILLSIQPVGANLNRYFELIKKYPRSKFSTIIDNSETIKNISAKSTQENIKANLYLDINNGMNRTGINPGKEALQLFEKIYLDPNLNAIGIHVYDGHIHDEALDKRQEKCDKAFVPVQELIDNLKRQNIPVHNIVAGGTPTFPIHAQRKNVDLSPGTPLLWDAGYAQSFKDLNFLPAAVLITRVISNPSAHITCFDLGHKSVAPEMPFPRVQFLTHSGLKQFSQSEEHLVVEHSSENKLTIGEVHYALPIHICPTVIKYDKVITVEDGAVTGSWNIVARDH